MIVVSTRLNGTTQEFSGVDADSIEVDKSNPDYIDISFSTSRGEKVVVTLSRLLLMDPEVRDEMREAAQHTNLFSARGAGSGVRD